MTTTESGITRRHVETQTEWEERMAKEVLAFARNEIYMDLRFLDAALSKLLPKAAETLAALATDGTYLYFPPQWTLRIFEKNPRYLDRAYLHSVLHCIFFHPWLRGKREEARWNLACDVAVEYAIDGMDKPCTRRILSWQRRELYEKLRRECAHVSASGIYRYLSEKTPEELALLQREFYTDDHRYWFREEQAGAVMPRAYGEWSKIARQTQMEQKMRGDDAGGEEGAEAFASQLRAEKSRRSYADFLRKFSVFREELHLDMDELDLTYYTYGLSLYKNMPLIEPQESREARKIREFVIVLDTSDSTGGELVEGFLRETYRILSQRDSFFSGSRIRILQCDNAVRSDDEVRSEAELKRLLARFTFHGGGGTDFRPAFAYVDKLIGQGAFQELGGLLYFTDGKGVYPKKKPEYKTAFLFLGDYDEDAVPAWAMRLRLEKEEFQ